jgi:ABC-type dipeptide/oligopeptide/nickel transport system permease component
MDLASLDQLMAQSQSLLIISLLVSVACAVLCGVIAARRQLRWVYWSTMGFVFGPFALPFVFLAKRKDPGKTRF